MPDNNVAPPENSQGESGTTRAARRRTRRRTLPQQFTSPSLHFYFGFAWDTLPEEVRNDLATFIYRVREVSLLDRPYVGNLVYPVYSTSGEHLKCELQVLNVLAPGTPSQVLFCMLYGLAKAYDYFLDPEAAQGRDDEENEHRAFEMASGWVTDGVRRGNRIDLRIWDPSFILGHHLN